MMPEMLLAYTRAVSPSLAECELTHLERVPIDVARAMWEHAAYEALLESLGATVRRLPPEPALPDAVFVEDTAVVLDEVAVITLPGAAPRRAETASTAAALAAHRPLLRVREPAMLDGGDVLVVGRRLYVGLSSRSNEAAVAQLAMALRPFDYDVRGVPFRGCLHLKSAVTQVADALLLVNPNWVDADVFAGCRVIEVDPSEPHAANALAIGGQVVHPRQFPLTRARLEAAGLCVASLDTSELAKAEAGVTCCSLLVRTESVA